MRAKRLMTLVGVALVVTSVSVVGCKDDENVPELSAEKIEAFQKRSDEKKRGKKKGKPEAADKKTKEMEAKLF